MKSNEINPEDHVVSINAYHFLKDIQEKANMLAKKGVGVSGKSLFNLVGNSFKEHITTQRRIEEETS